MPVQSDKTRRMYEVCLKKLRDHFAASDLSFLDDSSNVIKYIESLDCSDNSRKIFYIALKSTLRDLPDKTDATRKAEAAYQGQMDVYNAKAYAKMESQELDERERALWLDWPEIERARERAFETATDLYTYQDAIILCLYTLLPPARVDYALMRVVEAEDEAPEGNLLVVKQTRMEFVMREYKTAHKYGTKRLVIPPKLVLILRDWLQLNPSGWLLCTQDGLPMTEPQLGSRVRAVMNRLTGKNVGINIFRHSFISFLRKGEPALKDQKHIADAMGHSIGMSQLYRRL